MTIVIQIAAITIPVLVTILLFMINSFRKGQGELQEKVDDLTKQIAELVKISKHEALEARVSSLETETKVQDLAIQSNKEFSNEINSRLHNLEMSK